ncbi:MAG: hypothetical protein NTW08_00665 [Gammaproteobacteria bacterium]|nr:hypothetical protein [Gammaproteobacteria bacterium]
MIKLALFSLLISNPTLLFAGYMPGDVNFQVDSSPNNHAYKFRLIINGGPVTVATACVAPNTGLAQALSQAAIGVSKVKLTVQASDCMKVQSCWWTLNGYLDYDSNNWYNLFVDMDEGSFHS